MSLAQAIKKAYDVKCALDVLALAKLNTLRSFEGLPPIRPWYENCYLNIFSCFREVCCKAFCPCVMYRRKTGRLYSKYWWKRIFMDETYENEVFKHFLGYISAVLISLCTFIVMVYQLDYGIQTAAIYCAVVGLLLAIGLAFSRTIRCLTMLVIPNMASGSGRTFILMYILVLSMHHPVKNFHHNIMAMSDSATCGQAMAYNQTKELIDAAISPMITIMHTLRSILDSLKAFAKTLRQIFLTLKMAVEEIAAAIKRAIAWVVSMVKKCNEIMGGPYRKCIRAFDRAYNNCCRALGIFWFICLIVKVVKPVCHIARIGELLCLLTDFLIGLVRKSIGKPVSRTIGKVYDMFYVKVKFHYHYEVVMNKSRTYREVKNEIMHEVNDRLQSLDTFLNILNHVMMISVAFVFIKAILYRHKYLTNDKYDNRYISNQLKAIDERREKLNLETVFPLKWRETIRYKNTFSLRMSIKEFRKFAKGLIAWFGATLHASFYMVCDFGLYWILKLIRKHFSVKITNPMPAKVKLEVKGEGALADMYRVLVSIFDPIVGDTDLNLDTNPCLPDPRQPNYYVYVRILSLLLICLIFVIFESYLMRLRHVIANCYYPHRAQARAAWLYNHILKKRGSFVKFLRRQLKRKYQKNSEIHKISIIGGISARFPLIGKCFKACGYNRKACLSCAKEGRTSDYINFEHCDNIGCKAVYCLDCFADLNAICTVCMNPVDYGDDSDFSEERDSSEDDEQEFQQRRQELRQKKERIRQRQLEKSSDRQIEAFRNMLGATDSKLALSKMRKKRGLSGDVETGTEEEEPLMASSPNENYSNARYRSRGAKRKYNRDESLDYSYQFQKNLGDEESINYNQHNSYQFPPSYYYSPLEKHAELKRCKTKIDLVDNDFMYDLDESTISDISISPNFSQDSLFYSRCLEDGLIGVRSQLIRRY